MRRSPNGLQRGAVTVSGTAEPGATVEVFEGEIIVGAAVAGGGGAFAIDLELASRTHALTARSTDAAGDPSAPTESQTFEVDAEVPLVSIATRDASVFLPTEAARLAGSASDNRGVVGIELRYYDLTGAPVAERDATCACGPEATAVTWSDDDRRCRASTSWWRWPWMRRGTARPRPRSPSRGSRGAGPRERRMPSSGQEKCHVLSRKYAMLLP